MRTVLLTIAMALLPATAFAGDGTWLTDQTTRCRLWWPNQSAIEEDIWSYSGLHWTGPCRNGVANGHGRFEFASVERLMGNPPSSYSESGEGDFVQGKLTGKGFTVRQGDVNTQRSEGDFQDGLLNGKGIQSGQGRTAFGRTEGTFVNGKPNGWVVSYIESWKGSTRERASFDRYEGEYVNGKKNGRGIFVRGIKGCAAQMRYEGEYRNGRWNGRGTVTTIYGKTYSGVFSNDSLGQLSEFDLVPLEDDFRKVCR